MTYNWETHSDPGRVAAKNGETTRRPGGHPLPISVVIPVHNRARLLRRALGSIASQQPRRPAQVIVVDDASTDESRQVAAEWGAELIVHSHNRGAAAAYQTGLEAASEEWVALLDSDDEWLPHHLDLLWTLAPGNVLVACSCLEVGSRTDQHGFHGPTGREPIVLRSPAAILHPENLIPSSGAMFIRDAALEVGGFREMLCEDLDLWRRIMTRGQATLSPRVGMLYHTHPGQISADWEAMHAAHLRVVREFAHARGAGRGLVERRTGVSAWDRFRVRRHARDPRAARDLLEELLRHPLRGLGVFDVLRHRLATSRRAKRLARRGVASRGRAGWVSTTTTTNESLTPPTSSEQRRLS